MMFDEAKPFRVVSTIPENCISTTQTQGPKALSVRITADSSAFTDALDRVQIALDKRRRCAMKDCIHQSSEHNEVATYLDEEQSYSVRIYVCDECYDLLKHSLKRMI